MSKPTLASASYKEQYPIEQRKLDGEKVRRNFPNMIPIILERAPRAKLPTIEKVKYLCPDNFTIGQFYFIIRNKLKLKPVDSMYFFVHNEIANPLEKLQDVYNAKHEADKLLYVYYSEEKLIYWSDQREKKKLDKKISFFEH